MAHSALRATPIRPRLTGLLVMNCVGDGSDLVPVGEEIHLLMTVIAGSGHGDLARPPCGSPETEHFQTGRLGPGPPAELKVMVQTICRQRTEDDAFIKSNDPPEIPGATLMGNCPHSCSVPLDDRGIRRDHLQIEAAHERDPLRLRTTIVGEAAR